MSCYLIILTKLKILVHWSCEKCVQSLQLTFVTSDLDYLIAGSVEKENLNFKNKYQERMKLIFTNSTENNHP